MKRLFSPTHSRLQLSNRRCFSSTPVPRCGLVVMLSQSKETIDPAQLQKSLDVIKHRGPDSNRYWISEDKKVAFGHTRLSIIDLSENGNQPLTDPSGKLKFVVNGEIYDYKDHVRELSSEYKFQTSSDSEVVIALYQKYGMKGCLNKLRGEFAIVGWDGNSKQLFGARDRFGIKPLYYTIHNGKLHFASEIKSLLELGVPAIWEKEICVGSAPISFNEHRTFFKGIFHVPPGHFITATQGGAIRMARYWDFQYPKEYNHFTKNITYDTSRTEQECILQLRNYLLNSVKTRLVADVPVGVYLSGGLDSCSILGMASHVQGSKKPLRSFSIAFDGDKNLDESSIAMRMAESVNSEISVIKVNSDMLGESFAEAVSHNEAPIPNINGVAKFLLSKHVRDNNFKVVLTGEGSDEFFGGYGSFQVENFLRGSLDSFQKDQYQKYMNTYNVATKFWREDCMYDPTKSQLSNWLGYTPYMCSSFGTDFVKPCQDLTDVPYDQEVFFNQQYAHLLNEDMKSWHPVNVSLYLWTKTFLPNFLLMALGVAFLFVLNRKLSNFSFDRMEMAHSVEGRVPFLDHKLVEFVTQIPTNIKIKPSMDKWILREAVKPFITPEIYLRKKHPFLGPNQFKKGTKFYDFVNENLRRKGACPVFISQDKVIEALDQFHNLPNENHLTMLHDVPFVSLASFYVLQEKFNIKTE